MDRDRHVYVGVVAQRRITGPEVGDDLLNRHAQPDVLAHHLPVVYGGIGVGERDTPIVEGLHVSVVLIGVDTIEEERPWPAIARSTRVRQSRWVPHWVRVRTSLSGRSTATTPARSLRQRRARRRTAQRRYARWIARTGAGSSARGVHRLRRRGTRPDRRSLAPHRLGLGSSGSGGSLVTVEPDGFVGSRSRLGHVGHGSCGWPAVSRARGCRAGRGPSGGSPRTEAGSSPGAAAPAAATRTSAPAASRWTAS